MLLSGHPAGQHFHGEVIIMASEDATPSDSECLMWTTTVLISGALVGKSAEKRRVLANRWVPSQKLVLHSIVKVNNGVLLMIPYELCLGYKSTMAFLRVCLHCHQNCDCIMCRHT